jgi:hypothetical protein
MSHALGHPVLALNVTGFLIAFVVAFFVAS